MGRIVLRATAHHHGPISPGDRVREIWKVWETGDWYREITFFPEEKTVSDIRTGTLNPADFRALKIAMDQPWDVVIHHANEEFLWEFSMFNDIGALVKRRPEGNVQGIEPYEEIIRILRRQA